MRQSHRKFSILVYATRTPPILLKGFDENEIESHKQTFFRRQNSTIACRSFFPLFVAWRFFFPVYVRSFFEKSEFRSGTMFTFSFFGYASSVKFDSFSTFVTSNSSSIYFNFIIRNFFLHSWILEDRCETRLGNVKKEKENLIAVEKYRTCEHSIIASLGEKRFPNCMTFVTRFQFSALAFRNNFHFSNFTVIFVLEPCHD